MNPDPVDVQIPISVSERQTAGWDLRNAARNYSTLVAAQIAVALFSFASVWLVTRQLGTEGYGGVVAIIAASQIAQIFVNWTGVSLARYGVEEFVGSGKITQSFWARSAIFFPNTLILLLCGPLWLPIVSGWLKLPPNAIWFVAAHFAVSAVWLHIQQAMQGAKLPRLQGVMLAAERLVIFVSLSCLVAAGRLDGITAIAAYIAAPALMTVAGLVAVRRLFSWRLNVDTAVITKLLKFSLPLIPSSLVGYFSTSYLDAIFISRYLTKSDLGVYSVAYQMNGILMQFPLLAGSLLLPLFVTLRTGGNNERVTTYMESVLPLLTLVGGLVCVIAAFILQFLIPLVFGPQLYQSAIIFWVLSSSTAIALPGLLGYGPYSNAVSATSISTATAIAAAAVNVAANIVLIPRYGLVGCAWATVLAYVASLLVMMAITRRRFSIAYTRVFTSVLPALAGSAYAGWSGNSAAAVLLAFSIAFAIFLIHRKAFMQSLDTLVGYRPFLSGS